MTRPTWKPRKKRTHCKRGHELTDANVRWKNEGKGRARTRQCKICLKAAQIRCDAIRYPKKKLTVKRQREEAIANLWAKTLAHKDRTYSRKMVEAKAEYDHWLLTQHGYRGKKINVKDIPRKVA